MMWWYMPQGMGWWMLLGGGGMILFWGLVLGLIIWGITRWTRSTHNGGRNSPVEVAKERYARGEITREQFEQIKRDIA